MSQSKVERLIRDQEFSYLQPYFYNHPYAIRCELGVGDEDYMIQAKRRAVEIFDVLFPLGADAMFFNYWIFDHSDCGEANRNRMEALGCDICEIIENALESETKQLKFLLENMGKYRHHTVVDLKTYGDFDDEYVGKLRRNRVICYRDGEEFDYEALIDLELNGNGHNTSFVSFENECILSIYDDRGCDVVFATYEKFKEFYHKLEPYFLPYDAEEMKNRLNRSV